MKVPTLRTARALATLAGLIFVLTGGGRIVGSDEVTMYQLARSLLRGRVDVPAGATLAGPDGRAYTKNAAGQAVAALPLVAAAEVIAARAPGGPARGEALRRAVVSLFNAIVSALLLGVLYAVARALGASVGAALGTAFLLGFATPLWVYAKSFMGEPLEGLGLLVALGGTALAREHEARAARWAGLGLFIASTTKLSVFPLALLIVAPLLLTRAWRAPVIAIVATFLFHALYNWARFRTPFETGYGHQATLSAYSTPLWVGLYGLLLSSGKGLAWFAPPAWLAPLGGFRLRERARPAALALVLALALAALVYGTFEHWAGDGSFGPRYLLPLLPLLFVGVALWLAEPGARWARRLAWVLGVAGFLVQVGGVSIYFGAQMRERGDFPYTRALSDPRFMSESHFNPYFSPITDHWRMLRRNAAEHLTGRAPRIQLGAPAGGGEEVSGRTGLTADEERSLLHALDFWWCYAGYAGIPRVVIAAALAALLALLALAARALATAARAEGRA
jgi:hypothetical protein